jgi:hypothetical protein
MEKSWTIYERKNMHGDIKKCGRKRKTHVGYIDSQLFVTIIIRLSIFVVCLEVRISQTLVVVVDKVSTARNMYLLFGVD